MNDITTDNVITESITDNDVGKLFLYLLNHELI